MSETLEEQPELQPVEIIARGFHDWLKAEIENSRTNNNAVLNGYSLFQKSLSLPYENPASVNAGKSRSHFQRLKLWTDEVFAVDIDSDEADARQLFGALMGLSGAHREQCFILASDQESYMNLRYGANPLGLDVADFVEKKLHSYFGKPSTEDLKLQVVSKHQLIAATHAVNQLRDETAHQLFSGKPIIGTRKAIYAARQLRLRKAWLDLGIDYLLYGAQKHGGELARVPFLEPKTIATAQLVYPLKGKPPYFTPDSEKTF